MDCVGDDVDLAVGWRVPSDEAWQDLQLWLMVKFGEANFQCCLGTGHGERSRSKLLFKLGGTENTIIEST